MPYYALPFHNLYLMTSMSMKLFKQLCSDLRVLFGDALKRTTNAFLNSTKLNDSTNF